jgi:nitroimidazol reductase NimA-like FMN-containing flavoprotein (pyridoxamine 5'-phosphate oxidase superfamily)
MVGELTRDECLSVLTESFVGHLGCHADGEVYVVPVSYALNGDRILGQTTVGKKVEMMRANPQVCLQVDTVNAVDNWRSVIVWGKYQELSAGEKPAAARVLMDTLSGHLAAEGRSGRDFTPDKVAGRYHGVVYAIRIERMTGRYEQPD